MQFDHLSYGDFNPHLLYIGKKTPTKSGEDHSHDYLELTYILSGQARYTIEGQEHILKAGDILVGNCLLYTSPSPRDRQKSRMPSSA